MPTYFDLQNSPVLTTPSTLTVPKITSIGYPGDDTAADPAGGQTITLTGSGFAAGASVIINGAAVGVVSVVSSTTITFTSPAQSAGSYVLYVVNTDGSTAVAVPGIQYSGTPTWTTAAGSLGSYTETVAIANTVTATGDAPVTYSVFSGSLPTGATLNSANGYISGTSPAAASPTTYTFTIRATDAQQQDTNRTFSLTINPDVVTWSSPANGTTYASVANTALANVPLSASAASGQNITYTANALPTGLSISGSNITGTPTVVANSSTLLTATAATTNATATRTINWVISVASDTYFPYVTTLLSASTPASTFVTDASSNAFAVTVNGDTRSSNFGPYTPGYYSGLFAGASNQTVTIATAANSNIGAIAGTRITYEYWFYCTTIQAITAWYVGIFGNFQAVAANGRIAFGIRGSSATSPVEAYFYWTTSTSTTDMVVTTATVNQNSWNHVAVSIDATAASNSTITIYLNGVGETFTGKNLSTHTTDPGIAYAIGGDYSFQNFTGYLSNFRVTRGTTVYSGNFTPSTTPFTANANTVLLALQSNRFIDTSTNAYALTPNSGPQISGFDPFLPDTNFAGRGSGYFSATSAYGRVAMAGADSFGTGDFTVECWLYPSNSAINISMPSASTNSWAILTYGSQLYWQENGGNLGGTGYGTVPLNTWTHLAVARSGSTIRLFVNGVQVYSASNSFNYSGAPATRTIGPGDGGGIPAYIGDFRIVKGTAVYTTAFTPPATPLTAIANTSLLTLQNNQPNNNSMFLDSSTSNFNITRNGNTTQGTFSPYGGGWSNYFDGNGDGLSLSGSSKFAIATSTTPFTIEAWVFLTAAGGSLFSELWTGGSDSVALTVTFNDGTLVYGSGQFLGIGYYTGSTWVTAAVANTSIPLNTWTHVACVFTGSTTKIFYNGVDVTKTSNPTPATTWGITGVSGNGWLIGRNWDSTTTTYMTGYVSNFRFVNGTAVYNNAFTVPTAPLTPIANTTLLTCNNNRFVDSSPNNFAITRIGDASTQRFNPFNPVLTTPTSYSGFFDGTGDYLSVATANAAGLSKFLTGNFTVECWAYLTDSSVDRTIISAVYLWAAGANYNIEVRSGGLMHVQIGNGITLTSGTVSWPLNQWNHIALVRTNTTSTTLYLNGVSVATSSTNWTADEDCPVTVGCFNINGGSLANYWNGYISNLRIVNGTGVYTGNFTPPTAPLTAIANTSFLTLQSATIIDNSVNNVSITSNGDTAPRQFNPFGWTTTTGGSAAYTPALYGGSAYFDGSGDSLSLAGNSAFTLGAQPGDFTIECWVYLTTTPGNYAAFMTTWTDASTNYTNRWFLGIASSKITWYNDAGTFAIQDSVNVPLNQWIHVAAVRSGSTITLYKNGVSLGTQTTGQAYTTNGGLTMGYAGSNSNYITGYISDARILRGTAIYTSNFQPPVAPLTARQNTVLLNNMTGAGIYDSAMITTYETVGNASISTSIKKYGNTSIAFDGSGDALASPANINLAVGGGDFTIEMWVNGANNGSAVGGSFPRLFTLGTAQGSGCIESYNASGTMYVDISGAGGPISFTASTLLNSTWNHYAITRSGTSLRAFVNGTQVGTTATNSTNINLAATTQSWIGAISASAGNFNGYIDDFRITKGVARYTSNFTPTSTPFITN